MTNFTGFGEYADDLREFADETLEAKARVEDAFGRALLRVARRMAGSAARRAPKDTGALARSIEVYRRAVLSWGYGTDKEYAKAQEYGRDPETIRPQTADALSWINPETGDRVFAMKVEYPGQEPQPYVIPAFRDHEDDLADETFRELGLVFDTAYS